MKIQLLVLINIMSSIIDITNLRFGKLIVLKYYSIALNGGGSNWLCACDCGNTVICLSNRLRRGLVNSCGCISKEITIKRNYKHGLANSKLYRVYRAMISRCLNKKNKSYKYYGGRGIKVCDRWLESFENFYEDMGNKYSNGLSIDRIDVNGDYCPENCKFSNSIEQARNKTDNILIEYNNDKKILKDWADYYNLSYKAVWARINYGWDLEKVFNTPIRKNKIKK